jgi:hypothetical protein
VDRRVRRWAGRRQEADPVGLLDGPAIVRDIAYQSACEPNGDCRATGWVATVAGDAITPIEELRVSEDGRSWESIELVDEGAVSIVGVAFHQGRWVVITDQPRAGRDDAPTTAWTSRNLTRWSPTPVPSVEGGGRDLAAGGAGFVLVGTEQVDDRPFPRAWRSSNGDGWLELQTLVPSGRVPRAIHHVVSTDLGYVAMSGTHGDAWISGDGEDWRHLVAFAGDQSTWVGDVVSAGDVLLAGGRSSAGRPTFWSASLAADLFRS